jgi:phosphatidylglycerophosphate synthase
VRPVHAGPLGGLLGVTVLLGALAGTGGLTARGWMVGTACGVVLAVALAQVAARHGADRLGPADWVTLTRAALTAGVAAIAADAFGHLIHVATLVGLATAALVLDGVDGWVARRTGTASPLGARFDMEVDAFLILVLSVFVARSMGAVWVLAIGGARYAFLAAGWVIPWLTGPLPPRFWRKVVAATQGVVLTCAAAQALPSALSYAALVASLGLLAESFGRDVRTLWRQRRTAAPAQANRNALVAVGAEETHA